MPPRRLTFGDPSLPSAFDRPAVTVGVFDGVHRGHRVLLDRLTAAARADGVDAVAITFDPHPRQVLAPGAGPELLTSLEHRIVLLGRAGLSGVVVLPFDQQVARWSAETFVLRVLVEGLRASRVVVGANHRFGADREGDLDLLQRLGREHGFTAEEVSLAREDAVISSTAIREALSAGDLPRAEALLGRQVSVLGDVVQGDQRGRTIGFPTANLDLHHEACPRAGVYVARARLLDSDDPERLYPAVVNIGRRPTFHTRPDRDLVEVHLLEGGRDLYGQRLEVVFERKLRDEQRFDGPQALVAQIEADVAQARQVLAAPSS